MILVRMKGLTFSHQIESSTNSQDKQATTTLDSVGIAIADNSNLKDALWIRKRNYNLLKERVKVNEVDSLSLSI